MMCGFRKIFEEGRGGGEGFLRDIYVCWGVGYFEEYVN